MDENFIETVNYRNFSLPIYYDDPGQQFYTILDGQELSFGSFNINYKDDIQFIIDEKLDTIKYLEDFHGAKLSWFDNSGFRDIKLTYRGRLIKVFLVEDETKVDLESLEKEAKKIILKFLKINKNN